MNRRRKGGQWERGAEARKSKGTRELVNKRSIAEKGKKGK